jgi:ribonuclease HII
MKYPNFNEENKLWKKGFKVIGIDEVGRGPLAGPVVACAFCFDKRISLKGINDSKKLSSKQREEIYEKLKEDPNVKWGIGKVSEKVIDRINILEATKLAMNKAINNLKIDSGFLIIDGNFKIKSNIPQKSIIKADEKVYSCSAASIIAKVVRDRMMIKYHKKYPEYSFDKHKGYGTKAHIEIIREKGLCDIHRKSFHLA